MSPNQETTSRIFLIGNPNAGKSLLFNLLTGMNAKVANFPGITVERKSGRLTANRDLEVIDLPGIYSLSAHSKDEQITTGLITALFSNCSLSDVVVAVVDATQLKKGLYLVAELKEKYELAAIVLTMADLAGPSLTPVVIKGLSKRINVPIFLISSVKDDGVSDFASFLSGLARRQHSSDEAPQSRNQGVPSSSEVYSTLDLSQVEMRHRVVASWLSGIKLSRSKSATTAGKIDKVLLHPFAGPLFLVFIFFLLFEGLFVGSKPIIAQIDNFKNYLSVFFRSFFAQDSLLGSLIADGIIGGVGSVLTFVPLIAFLFLFLGALEDSGYMARAVYLLHRIMSKVGLSGRAFVPLVSGFSCSVPAILSTRIMESWSERLVTILVTPLISCSARLPIYGLLIAAGFSKMPLLFGVIDVGALVMIFMYVFGVALTFTVAAVLRFGLIKGRRAPLLLEFPDYRWPRPRTLFFSVKSRVLIFLKEAGTVILALTILLWALFTFPLENVKTPSGSHTPPVASMPFIEVSADHLEQSYAGQLGHLIEPLIEPLGFNWKIGVGLIASFAAREVFISTFGIIYGLSNANDAPLTLAQAMRDDVNSKTGKRVYSPLVVLSLLVFFAVALQCMSTVAATRKETGSWRWPLFQLGYLNALAWILSFSVFQGGSALGF